MRVGRTETERQPTVGDVGEEGLLRRLARRFRFKRPSLGVLTGVGDDGALLLPLTPAAVLTTDMLVEGIDFQRDWATFADIGHKAAAVNLSDLAAMGAKPRALLCALALQPSELVANVLSLLTSLDRVGRSFAAPLVGGDLSRIDGPLVVSVTAVGEVSPKQALGRHRARPGDRLLVSGCLGASAAGLHRLQTGHRGPRALVRRQLRPTPQIALGRALAAWGRVRACADISDGLAKDALHLVPPGCGIVLDTRALPLPRELVHAERAVEWALFGGEDFELVFALDHGDVGAAQALARRHKILLTDVGKVTGRPGVALLGPCPEGAAFDHFRPRCSAGSSS